MEHYKDFKRLPGTQKAAILLALVKEHAEQKDITKRIVTELDPEILDNIEKTMRIMPNFDKKTAIKVLKEFIDRSTSAATSLPLSSIANDLVAESTAINRFSQTKRNATSKGLESWNKAKPNQIVRYLKDEHPQVVAVVLSYFEPAQAANVLALLKPSDRPEVIKRIAELNAIKPSSIDNLNEVVEQIVSSSELSSMTSLGGVKTAADILNLLPTGLDKDILLNIADEDETMATDIEESMFIFEDLINMADEYITQLLDELPQSDIVYALKSAETALVDKFLKALPKRMAIKIKDDLRNTAQVRMQVVEDSQRKILQRAKTLSDEGVIVLPGQGDEMFV